METTIAAGGRYDGLFGRFNPKSSYPSLGFAIGIERFCMVLKGEGWALENDNVEVYICFEDVEKIKGSASAIREELFPKKILDNPRFSCFVSYEKMKLDKHVAMALRMEKHFFYFIETTKSKRKVLKDMLSNRSYRSRFIWRWRIYVRLMEGGLIKNLLSLFFG